MIYEEDNFYNINNVWTQNRQIKYMKKGRKLCKKRKEKKEFLLHLSRATPFTWVCEEIREIRWGQQNLKSREWGEAVAGDST